MKSDVASEANKNQFLTCFANFLLTDSLTFGWPSSGWFQSFECHPSDPGVPNNSIVSLEHCPSFVHTRLSLTSSLHQTISFAEPFSQPPL